MIEIKCFVVKCFAEALKKEDYPIIHAALRWILEEEDKDLSIIMIREFTAFGLLMPGKRSSAVVSGIILDYEPWCPLLTNFARKLGDGSMAKSILSWMDSILIRNVHLEPKEWIETWSQLDVVKKIRYILSTV